VENVQKGCAGFQIRNPTVSLCDEKVPVRGMKLETFTIEKQIGLKAPIESVFSALTNSEEIPKYFPLKSVESTWEVGSEVLYKGEVNGVPFTDFGIIEKLTSPTEYRYRYWSDNHGTERNEENHLTISYSLEKTN
jgi:uncharacterized protein YndB with AHSA1/START domain